MYCEVLDVTGPPTPQHPLWELALMPQPWKDAEWKPRHAETRMAQNRNTRLLVCWICLSLGDV